MHIVIGVSASISAYKAVELMRLLQKQGHSVRICMTKNAQQFIGKATFDALADAPCVVDVFENSHEIIHVNLARWADIFIVCPASANVIARLAQGFADDALCATALALKPTTKKLVAPAMNVNMWNNQATQNNIKQLEEQNWDIILPVSGRLACGTSAAGKLADVADIAEHIYQYNVSELPHIKNKKILITAGPTYEAIDPVRYIANASSGKMGYALAGQAVKAQAEVSLISGPCTLDIPQGLSSFTSVVSTQQMYDAVCAQDFDIAICAAAVADFTPTHPQKEKIKKTQENLCTLELTKTQDILAHLTANRHSGQYIVGFAAETNNLVEYAQQKCITKDADMIVANDVSRKDSTFGSSTNKITIIEKDKVRVYDTLTKQQAARKILERIDMHLSNKEK